MALKITDILKSNGLDAKGKPGDGGQQQPPQQETPEQKLAREEKERLAAGGGNQETAEEKLAREEKEKLAAGSGGNQETAEEKLAREEKERQQQGNGIDDATLIAELQKRGKKLTTLDDIDKPAPEELTEEQKREADQQRKDAIRQFGMKNKKATSTDFDNYARETGIPPKELAFNLYRAERIEALKKKNTPADQIPDDKALKDEFDEAHFQFAAEDDPKRIRSEKLLQKTVDEYIENKYSNILDLEEEYNIHEETGVQREGYGKVIDTVIAELGDEMDFEIIIDKDKNEKFPFKFKITPEVHAAIKQSYLNDISFNSFGKGKVNKELLQAAVKGTVIQREFSKILSEGALAYASTQLDAAAKGRRGIPPTRKEEGSEGGEKKINKVVKGILDNAENKKVLQTN